MIIHATAARSPSRFGPPNISRNPLFCLFGNRGSRVSYRRLENFPDVIGNYFLTLFSRVDAVGLIEVFHAANAFEEEGDEGRF